MLHGEAEAPRAPSQQHALSPLCAEGGRPALLWTNIWHFCVPVYGGRGAGFVVPRNVFCQPIPDGLC